MHKYMYMHHALSYDFASILSKIGIIEALCMTGIIGPTISWDHRSNTISSIKELMVSDGIQDTPPSNV